MSLVQGLWNTISTPTRKQYLWQSDESSTGTCSTHKHEIEAGQVCDSVNEITTRYSPLTSSLRGEGKGRSSSESKANPRLENVEKGRSNMFPPGSPLIHYFPLKGWKVCFLNEKRRKQFDDGEEDLSYVVCEAPLNRHADCQDSHDSHEQSTACLTEREMNRAVTLHQVNVGSRLSLCRPNEESYVTATVTQLRDYCETRFCLRYDRDSEEWVDLRNYRFHLLFDSSSVSSVSTLDSTSSSTKNYRSDSASDNCQSQCKHDITDLAVGAIVMVQCPGSDGFVKADVIRIRDVSCRNRFYLEFHHDKRSRIWMDLLPSTCRVLRVGHMDELLSPGIHQKLKNNNADNIVSDGNCKAAGDDDEDDCEHAAHASPIRTASSLAGDRSNKKKQWTRDTVCNGSRNESLPVVENHLLPEFNYFRSSLNSNMHFTNNNEPLPNDNVENDDFSDDSTIHHRSLEANVPTESEVGEHVREGNDCVNSNPDDVIVGSRLGIWWPKDSKYYHATVVEYRRRRNHNIFRIIYDDNEEVWLNLCNCKFRFLRFSKKRPISNWNENDDQSRAEMIKSLKVGSLIAVYWDLEKKYYHATLQSVTNDHLKPHLLRYDDEEEEQVNLKTHYFYIEKESHKGKRSPTKGSPASLISKCSVVNKNNASLKRDICSAIDPQPAIESLPKKKKKFDPNQIVEKVPLEQRKIADFNEMKKETDADYESLAVGSHVRIWRPENNTYSDATVIEYRRKGLPKQFRIQYKDDEEEWINILERPFCFLPGSIRRPNGKRGRDHEMLIRQVEPYARIAVWWALDKQYFPATVLKIRDGTVSLLYDDDEEERIDLHSHDFYILSTGSERPANKKKMSKKSRSIKRSKKVKSVKDDAESSSSDYETPKPSSNFIKISTQGKSIAVEMLDPLSGNVLALFRTLTEAGKVSGVSQKEIKQALTSKKQQVIAGGYAWRKAKTVQGALKRGKIGAEIEIRPLETVGAAIATNANSK